MKKIQFLLTFFAALLLGLTACQHSIDAPVPQQFADAGQKHAFDPKILLNDLGVNFFACISWQDMNWYYNSLFNLVTNAPFPISLVKGSNKSFLYSAIYGDTVSNSLEPPLFHWGNIYYGLAHPIFRTCCEVPVP